MCCAVVTHRFHMNLRPTKKKKSPLNGDDLYIASPLMFSYLTVPSFVSWGIVRSGSDSWRGGACALRLSPQAPRPVEEEGEQQAGTRRSGIE